MKDFAAIGEADIIEGVLAEFSQLAKIPRPSGHEKEVSDYLYQLFTDMGCRVIQDEAGNIIADLSASDGWQTKPLTVLQAHMDMVCVAEDGIDYDPLHDPIVLVREGELLHAAGTSLGADDGIGIAIIVYIMKNLSVHGPLRAIITTDEEIGMTGSRNLAAQHFQDVKYLINCDSEDWDMLTVGSAGSGEISFVRPYFAAAYSEPGTAYTVTLQGLKGGHSGEEIGCGTANAIQAMAFCLDFLRKHLAGFQLAALDGGRARNVIPGRAEAVFFAEETAEVVEELLDEAFEHFMGLYGDTEQKATLVLSQTAAKAECMDAETGNRLIDLLICLPNGVSAMSQLCPGMVESSANIGVAVTDTVQHELMVQYMPRSSRGESIREYYARAEALGSLTGFKTALGTISPGWQERKDSRLAEIMQQIFEEQNRRPMRVSSIHAGLECSWHLQRNPEMDIVSVGTNNNDIHSPKETLELRTIAPQVRLIAEALQKLD